MAAWDRRTGETLPAWRAFQAYRDLGSDRSIRKTLDAAGKPPSTRRHWERWSVRHDWSVRARAWDEHLDQVVQRKQVSAAQEAAERHARYARNLQSVAQLPLQEIARRLKADEIDLKDVTVGDLFDMIRKAGPSVDRAMKIERLIQGEPTERTDHQGFVVQRIDIGDLESGAEPADADD